MKKLLFAAAALALTAGSALAADLPSHKGPPMLPPPPPPMWTGFYVGLNAGYTWNASNSIVTQAGDVFDFIIPGLPPFGAPIPTLIGLAFATSANNWNNGGNNGGFIGGGQIGYNWQFAGSFVGGVEADIQGVAGSSGVGAGGFGVGFDPATLLTPMTLTNVAKRLDYLGTVRGRLGYLFTPTLLVYGTGGLAYGGVNLAATYTSIDTAGVFGPGFGASAFSDTRVGWTAGGGLEWMFWPNWSAKVEYLYYDLGSVQTNNTVVAGFGGIFGPGILGWAYSPITRARFDGHIVRAGLNYHFNFGAAPVVAKY